MDIKYDLLGDLNEGKEKALEEIYRLYFHALCAFGSRYVQEEAAVADIVEEVFIKVWNRRRDFQALYSLRSFMYLAVRNACLNYNRDTGHTMSFELVEGQIMNISEEDENFVIEEEFYRLIRQEIGRLPKSMKRVFDFTLLDMSIPEIARSLGVSENTVRNQRARAREILRERLKDRIFFLLFFV